MAEKHFREKESDTELVLQGNADLENSKNVILWRDTVKPRLTWAVNREVANGRI